MRATARLLAPWVVLVCLCPASLHSQWSAAVEVGVERFWGGSVETGPEHRSFRPYRPTSLGAAISRRGRRAGFEIHLGYTEAALALEGTEALVAAKGVFTIYSLTPEISYRIATVGTENALWLQGGPLFELWNIVDLDSRARIGGQAALMLVVPLGRRIRLTASAGAALMASPFDDGELLDGYERRALWRRRLAGGLEYGF